MLHVLFKRCYIRVTVSANIANGHGKLMRFPTVRNQFIYARLRILTLRALVQKNVAIFRGIRVGVTIAAYGSLPRVIKYLDNIAQRSAVFANYAKVSPSSPWGIQIGDMSMFLADVLLQLAVAITTSSAQWADDLLSLLRWAHIFFLELREEIVGIQNR